MATDLNPVTHHIRYDQREGVRGWVVIARLPTGRLVVTRPRTANEADNKRLEFNKATATGRLAMYEQIPTEFETPDEFP